MAKFKLTLSFGGLCLFVHRTMKGREGLCVLMVRDTKGHGHRPQRVEKRAWKEWLDGTHVLMDLEGDPAGAAKVETALHFTRMTGGRVPSRMFDVRMPTEVAARFFLPYPKSVTVTTPTVPIDYMGGTGHTLPDVAGTVDLEYSFTTPFTIGTLPINAHATVELANVANPNPPGGVRPKKTPLAHASMYYALFEGQTSTPDFWTTADVTIPGPAGVSVTGPVRADFVDPVDCTVGTGCEVGDLNCT